MIFPKFQAPWANWTAQSAGALALRIFLAMVLIVQGLVKFDSADGKHTLTEADVEKAGEELVAEEDYLVIKSKVDPLEDIKDDATEAEIAEHQKKIAKHEEDAKVVIPLHKDGKPDHFSPQYAHEWGMKTYGKLILENTSPAMMPRWAVAPYVTCLPYALLALGLMVLTGIFGRFAMFLSVFLFASLAYGLFLIQDETAVQMILYVLLAANALFLSAHQRLGLTKL